MTGIPDAKRIGVAATVLFGLMGIGCNDDGLSTDPDGADYALSVAPAALTIVAGANSSASVFIERTNFTGEVALQLQNPPAGISGVFTTTPATASGSGLVVSVAANTAPGNYPLTIQGAATGPGLRTTTLTVAVPPPPSGGNVEYQFCSESMRPAFFAYQDGNGPWQPVTGSTSGGTTRFVINLTQGRGGVVFVHQTENALRIGRAGMSRPAGARRSRLRGGLPGLHHGAGRGSSAEAYETLVLYASTIELAQDAIESCAQTRPTKTVTGIVTGVPTGAYGIVSLGGVTDIFGGATSTNPMTFAGVPSGPVDLAGSRTTPGNPPDRVIVVRNLDIADGGSLPSAIDFNGPGSSAPATATATITGAAGDNLEVFTDLVTARGVGGLWFELAATPSTTRTWAGLSAAAMATGDFHGLVVFGTPPGASGDFRVSVKYLGPVANSTIALGPQIAVPATSQVAGAGPYPRFRFQGTLPGEYNKGVSIEIAGAEGGNAYSILATSSYLAAAGNPLAYDFTMPDLLALGGFPAAARLTPGANAVAASGFGFTGTGIFDLRPSLGGEFKAALKTSTIEVP